MTFTRRTFLRDGAQALGAASLLGSGPLLAARDQKKNKASAGDITVKDVGGLALFTGAGCNVIGMTGPDGALLVDGGLAVNSAVLLNTVQGNLKSKRVNTLINTHWHPEQTGSNDAVGKAGGVIIGHEVTRLALTRTEQSPLFEGRYGPLPEKARPTKTTYNTGTLEFAGETVDYRYLPAAHTNGGLMHGFLRSYDILVEVAKPDTIIVPAFGATLKGADLPKQRDMYRELFRMFFISFNKGYGPMDIVAEHPLKDYEAQYGDPAQFLEYAYRSTQLAT